MSGPHRQAAEHEQAQRLHHGQGGQVQRGPFFRHPTLV
jgi:hypothetical protein